LFGITLEFYRFEPWRDSTGLEPGKVKERIHELQQSVPVPQYEFDPLALFGCERIRRVGECVLGRPEQQRERGSKFVAHVGKERRLYAIECRKGFSALSLLFECPGFRNARCDLARNESDESLVFAVEWSERIKPRDQKAVRTLVRRRQERDF